MLVRDDGLRSGASPWGHLDEHRGSRAQGSPRPFRYCGGLARAVPRPQTLPLVLRPGVAGLLFVVLIGLVATFAGILAPYSPIAVHPAMRGSGPSLAHPLGYDHIGRDILSRLIYGSRIAMVVAVFATGLAVLIGVTVGTAARYLGGHVDLILSRITDALMAFPILVLLIALVAVVGPSLTNVILVIGATGWASYARVVRAEVLSLREQDFV